MTLVLKIGGARGIGGDALLDDLAEQATRGPIVVVHGGSDETTRLQERLGRPAEFVTSPSGQVSRRTDRDALEAFAMATALVNRRLVEGLAARGVRAFGLSGLDGGVLRARRKSAVRAVVDGRVRVLRNEWTGRPTGADALLLRALLDAGCVPIVAPLARGEAGEMLNVDGDRAAGHLAGALGAATLAILTNVPGLLADVDDETSLVRFVSREEFDDAETLARGRMRKKLMGAREALEAGVERVVIADARRERPVAAALQGIGTVVGEPLPRDAMGVVA